MALTLYGIPTCGMVKSARKWLDARGVDYEWIDLREAAPDRGTSDAWMAVFRGKDDELEARLLS